MSVSDVTRVPPASNDASNIVDFARIRFDMGYTDVPESAPYETDNNLPARIPSAYAKAFARVRAFTTAVVKHCSIIGFRVSGLVYIRRFSEYTFGAPAKSPRIVSIISMLFAETSIPIVVSMPSDTDFCSSRFHSVFSCDVNCVVCISTGMDFRASVIWATWVVALRIDSIAVGANVVTRRVIATLSRGADVKHSPLTFIVRGIRGCDRAPNNNDKIAPAPTTVPIQMNVFFMVSPFLDSS